MNAPKGTGNESAKAEICDPIKSEILKILTLYQIWYTGNFQETKKFWHTLLNDKFINDQYSLNLMYGMVRDTLHGFDRFDEFLHFLRTYEPSSISNLHSALPSPNPATICSLLESLHGRVSALEKLRLA
jgi:hypothetical protein